MHEAIFEGGDLIDSETEDIIFHDSNLTRIFDHEWELFYQVDVLLSKLISIKFYNYVIGFIVIKTFDASMNVEF